MNTKNMTTRERKLLEKRRGNMAYERNASPITPSNDAEELRIKLVLHGTKRM